MIRRLIRNPALRGSSKVEATEKKATTAPKVAAAPVKKPPVCELQGKKWVVVSYYHCINIPTMIIDRKTILIIETLSINAANFHQSVYVYRL